MLCCDALTKLVQEEDDPLDADYDDLEFDMIDTNIDLEDDPDGLTGEEMLEIAREELMEE